MACFADINVSQGNVATYARCSEIFDIHLTANLPRNLPVKKFLKLLKNWQNYGHESVAPFFGPPCTWNFFYTSLQENLTEIITEYGCCWSCFQTEAFVLHILDQTNDGHKCVERSFAWRQQVGRDIHRFDRWGRHSCRSGGQYQTLERGPQRTGS